MKAQKLSELEANRILKLIITGWNINRISYHVSGWEIRFISPSNEKPDEFCLWASDVTIPNVNLWRDKFEGLSTELNNKFKYRITKMKMCNKQVVKYMEYHDNR